MGHRLSESRRKAGFATASEAADRFGWKLSTYLGHENGSRGFRADKAKEYAKAFRVTANWLLYGDNEPQQVEFGMPAPDDARLVPVYDVEASAGNGATVDSEHHVMNLAFSQQYLREMTFAKGNDLAVIRVKGDSMEPTLLDDDLVMIDRTKRNLDYDGLFVLRFGDALHVKRIGRGVKRGSVMVISDNQIYPPVQTDRDQIDVIGKVLWYGRKV